MDSVVINSPSLANCNTLHIREDVEELRKAGVHFLHVDLMDGNYVPNLCFPLRFLKDLRQEYPDIILDVHMMVTDPGAYVESMAEAKVDYLSFHADSTPFAIRTIDKIRAANIRPGVVINPSQPVEVVEPYADLVEMVTLMAVEPGFAGQKFMPGTVERVGMLDAVRKRVGKDFLINVDGAMTCEYLIPCIQRGANVIVTGIFTVFNQPDGIVSACKRFNAMCKKGLEAGRI